MVTGVIGTSLIRGADSPSYSKVGRRKSELNETFVPGLEPAQTLAVDLQISPVTELFDPTRNLSVFARFRVDVETRKKPSAPEILDPA
jgi:hypothetical protein